MFNSSRRQILYSSLLWLAGQSGAQARASRPFSLWIEADLASRSNAIGPAIVQGVNEALLAKPELTELIDLRIINHHGNPDRLIDQLNALAKASDLKRVIGMIGGGDGNLAPIAARWATGRQLPYLMAWASNPRMIAQIQVETQAPTYLQRKAVTDDVVFDQYIAVLRQNSKKRWGLMLVNDGLGRASYDYILESAMASAGGVELMGVQWHDINAAQINTQYQTLKQRGAQSIFMVTHPYAAQSLAKALAATIVPSELSRRKSLSMPIICSSNAWSPQSFSANGGALTRVPFYFALPQAWQSLALTESFIGLANIFTQEWFGALASLQPLDIHLGRKPLLAQLLPVSAWRDEPMPIQFARYDSPGQMIFTDLSAAFAS